MATQAPTAAMRIGARGDDVSFVQHQLAQLGFHPGKPDGIFGSSTHEAVIEFQRAHGLRADGIAGAETRQRLAAAVVERTSAPQEVGDAPAFLSPSLARLQHEVRITAWALVEALLRDHPGYVRGRAGSFQLPPEPLDAASRPFTAWVAAVQPLLREASGQELHTRLMIVALAIDDPKLYSALSEGGFLRALVEEMREPLEAVLSDEGLERWLVLTSVRSSAPLVLDRPATEDALGREAFAGALAARLRDARASASEDGPLLVHIHGAWGSGKSTILNLLKRELTEPSDRFRPAGVGPPAPWVVIDFNAWQHQRIAPPWWWLLTSVYHGGADALARQFGHRAAARFRAEDYAWRLWTLRLPILTVIVFVAVAGLAAAGIALWGPNDLAGVVALAGGLVGLVAAVAGLMRAATRFALVGSAGGANAFMSTTRDPMTAVRRRYEHLVAQLDHPVAVFVDDLDRCNAEYIVELLEGVYTLFGTVPVTYVVAADRHWVCDSFSKVYSDFEAAGLPGRPLGYLFLEKTFQLSSAVPRLGDGERARFLRTLVGGDEHGPAELEQARREAYERFATFQTEQQIREELAKAAERGSLVEEQAAREAALVQAYAPKVRESREHLLNRFAHLLEPNPRSMKRLVNAYGFELDLQIMSGAEIGTGDRATTELALWTILNLRWPLLAEHLADDPDSIAAVLSGTPPPKAPASITRLFGDDDVAEVVSGAGVGRSLDASAIRRLVRLHTERNTEPQPV